MSSKTPLLLLLDGILSQEQNQIRDAMAQISSIVRKARKPAPLTGPNGAMATPDSDRVPLSEAVRMLLEADPSLVSVPSDHDNSLPLHFAASLGSVRVASLLIAKVRVEDLHRRVSLAQGTSFNGYHLFYFASTVSCRSVNPKLKRQDSSSLRGSGRPHRHGCFLVAR